MLCKKNVVHIDKVGIRKSSESEVLQGWIRIPEEIRGGIPNGSFVKIRANRRVVYCQLRGTSSKERIAIVNEHYRDILGVEAGQELDLDLTPIKWIFGKLRALPMHPDHLVRFGFGFSFVGLVMGMVALIIALLPYAIRSIGSPWEWAGWVSIISLIVIALIVGYLMGAVVQIFRSP